MTVILYPGIYNLILEEVDTEYTIQLYPGCQHFSFQCRTAVDCRFAFQADSVVSSVWATLKAGQAFSSPEKLSLEVGKERIYFATSSDTAPVIELVVWNSKLIG